VISLDLPRRSDRVGGHGRAAALPGGAINCPWDDEVRDYPRASATCSGRVSMACLGRHGRWGNTLLAYFFLTAFARVHRLIPEVPRWIGQDVLDTRDPSISEAHPVVLYDMVSEICQEHHHPMVTFDLAVSRARSVRAIGGRSLVVLRHPLLTPGSKLPASCLDLEGPYFLHTRHLAPHREVLRGVTRPARALREPLESAWHRLAARGDAVIGIHVRRADFDTALGQQGFEFVAPARWYRAWLKRIWRRYDKPVLFIATDSPGDVLPAFAPWHPVTARDLDVEFPSALQYPDLPSSHVEPDAAFFPDWFMLTRCHALATSNSTFSFTASMVNETASLFVRPDLGRGALVPFDPWDSEPLLFLPAASNLPLDAVRRLVVAQRGLGARAMRSNVRRAVRWYLSVLRMRAMACRYYLGGRGLSRELWKPQFYLATRRRYDAGASDDWRFDRRDELPRL
jgi:hypothetical protein